MATTTGGLSGEAEPSEATPEEELAYGASVGANGRFLLLDKLGEGGMGEVWLAKDQELSRKQQDHLVALKFISPSIRHDHRALEALRSEVLSSQALSHPNIVRIFDLHLSDHGMPFIKMEYVEGNSLRKWLKDEPSHVMPWRLVTQLTHQLASALRYAHEKVGIVHRDLKPANLLLDRGQVLKLSDFGISQSITARAGSSDELVALGTLVYASPQQLAGEPPTPADDIYSLGATLYELLSGTPPFVAETPEEMIRIIQEELPDPIPERLAALGRRNYVPAKLLILVQRCLDKDPHCRPKTHEISHLLPQITNA
ncbi:MAG TPA: serine/threonine-protein kinase, partial [Candidatus Sulfotelmatobacter sp.]|nr:serine/threonine-protein kinase [Candidatus Sulfotelmatobacter sp.]